MRNKIVTKMIANIDMKIVDAITDNTRETIEMTEITTDIMKETVITAEVKIARWDYQTRWTRQCHIKNRTWTIAEGNKTKAINMMIINSCKVKETTDLKIVFWTKVWEVMECMLLQRGLDNLLQFNNQEIILACHHSQKCTINKMMMQSHKYQQCIKACTPAAILDLLRCLVSLPITTSACQILITSLSVEGLTMPLIDIIKNSSMVKQDP